MALIDRLFRSKYSIRDPETLRLFDLFGWQSSSGVDVNPESALAFSAVYCAVKLISESIGSLPLPVYQRQEDGGKARAYQHPLYRLLQTQPNNVHSPMDLWSMALVHLLAWGNFYAEVDRDPVGNVIALWPLPPDRTEPMWKDSGSDKIPDDARKGVIYRVERLKGGFNVLPRRDVFHIAGLGFNGLKGRSVIRQARESIGLGIAQERLAGAQINNGQRPGIGIKLQGKFEDMSPTEIKLLKESFMDRHAGIDNAGRPIFLEEGMDLVQFAISPHDAQFLESRQFTVTEIARWFNMPPHKLKDLTRATFSNIEEQDIEWVQDTLRPWCVRIEQAITTQLVSPAEQHEIFAEFVMDAIMRGNTVARAEYFARMIQSGVLTPNEVRAKENWNPVEGMNVLYMPLNMMAVGGPDYDPLDAPSPREDDSRHASKSVRQLRSVTARRRIRESYQRVLRESTARVIRGERRNVMRAVGGKNGDELAEWLNDYYYGDHQAYIVKEMQVPFLSLADALTPYATEIVGYEGDPTTEVHEATMIHVEKMAHRFAVGHLHKLSALLSQVRTRRDVGEDEEELFSEQFDAWEKDAPDDLARMESVRMDGLVSKAIWSMAGVVSLTWVASPGSCPWCQEMDGRTVGIDGMFISSDGQISQGGATFSPSWNVTTPPLHDGCVCGIVPSLG